MKDLVLFLVGILLMTVPVTSLAQCSGQYTITYPAGSGTTTSTYNNGSGSVNTSYCPNTSSTTQSITVTPASNSTVKLTQTLSGSSTPTVYDAGTVSAGTAYTFTFPSPTVSATYQLSGVVACNNQKTLNVTLTLAPNLTLSANQILIAPGDNVTLTSTGSSSGSYAWSAPGMQNVSNAGTLTVSPAATTTYTVTAPTSCGSSTQQQVTITVLAVDVTPAAPTITSGQSVTLTATANVSGATYSWQNRGTDATLGTNASQTVSPTASTTYRVTATAAGLTASRDVTVTVSSSSPGPLPVQLVSFSAAWEAGQPRLAWRTASEASSAYFEVERSASGGEFSSVGRVAAAGSATSAIDYTWADASALLASADLLYYRLRQVDLDGKVAYSNVQVVWRPAALFEASVAPNPFAGVVQTRLLAPAGSPLHLSLRNVLGQQVAATAATGSAQEVTLPVSALPAGVYYLTIDCGTQRQVVRLLHQ